MKIEAIALDMDGTLLTSNHLPSENTKKYLLELEKKGVKIIIATGRAYDSTLLIIKNIGLKCAFVICYNGAVVYNTKNNSIVFEKNLEGIYVKKIIKIARKYDVQLNLYQNENIYTENLREEAKAYAKKCSIVPIVKNFDFFASYDMPKNLIIAEPEKLQIILNEIIKTTNNEVHTTFSSKTYLEILNKDINKGKTLLWLLNNLNISTDKTAAFGDAENDLEMLQVVKYGVAMGNAQEEFKKKLNYSTLSNDEDGIIFFLNNL